MTQKPGSHRDVRMRGFAERTVVSTALEWVDAQTAAAETEAISLVSACGRVVADNLTAVIDVPAFDRSAMDGYALRGVETDGAGDYNPLSFAVVGESLPGCPYPSPVPAGSAVRIMTGAPVPNGTDAVIPAEYASETDGTVRITASVSPGKHVGRRGEDVTVGTGLLAAGRRLRPQDVGLLASAGLNAVTVYRAPRIRLVITGNELVPPGMPRGEFQIFDSNSVMLAGLVARDGGVIASQLPTSDDREAVREALCAPGVDVILVSGGSSVGTEDHAPAVLAEYGELSIHGVAMRPSSPAGMGLLGGTLVFLLPGNPVSCLCAYDFFAGRAIRRLGGRNAGWPYPRREAVVEKKIVSAIGRMDYCRVRVEGDRLEPIALSGASILSSTTRADGFVIVPAEREGYAPGTRVEVFLYDEP